MHVCISFSLLADAPPARSKPEDCWVGWKGTHWSNSVSQHHTPTMTVPVFLQIYWHSTSFTKRHQQKATYLSELHVYTLSCMFHSSSDACILKIQQYKHKTRGFCSFFNFGLRIWNSGTAKLSSLSFNKAKLGGVLFSYVTPTKTSIHFPHFVVVFVLACVVCVCAWGWGVGLYPSVCMWVCVCVCVVFVCIIMCMCCCCWSVLYSPCILMPCEYKQYQ